VDDGRPISYEALAVGTPVASSNGTEFGKVHHVLQVPELDLFDGISVKTRHGLRFVDRDQITEITTTVVRCSLTESEAASLPPPVVPPCSRSTWPMTTDLRFPLDSAACSDAPTGRTSTIRSVAIGGRSPGRRPAPPGTRLRLPFEPSDLPNTSGLPFSLAGDTGSQLG